jgi:hypothetical protein
MRPCLRCGVPSSIFAGLAMSIRAFQAWSVAQAREMELEGVDSDALSWLDAGAYGS